MWFEIDIHIRNVITYIKRKIEKSQKIMDPFSKGNLRWYLFVLNSRNFNEKNLFKFPGFLRELEINLGKLSEKD